MATKKPMILVISLSLNQPRSYHVKLITNKLFAVLGVLC